MYTGALPELDGEPFHWSAGASTRGGEVVHRPRTRFLAHEAQRAQRRTDHDRAGGRKVADLFRV